MSIIYHHPPVINGDDTKSSFVFYPNDDFFNLHDELPQRSAVLPRSYASLAPLPSKAIPNLLLSVLVQAPPPRPTSSSSLSASSLSSSLFLFLLSLLLLPSIILSSSTPASSDLVNPAAWSPRSVDKGTIFPNLVGQLPQSPHPPPFAGDCAVFDEEEEALCLQHKSWCWWDKSTKRCKQDVNGMMHHTDLVEATSRRLAPTSSQQCIRVTLRTPSVCVDDPDYRDPQDYICGDWAGYDCATDLASNGFSVEQSLAFLSACPRTCGVCPEAPISSPFMKLALLDLSTGTVPVLLQPGSDSLDFEGPSITSLPTDEVVKTFCLSYPGNYGARVYVDGGTALESSRTSLNVTSPLNQRSIAHSSRSDSWVFFSLSNCNSSAPYQLSTASCGLCPPGSYSDAGTNGVCLPCARNSYASSPGSSSCDLCSSYRLDLPLSLAGSNSSEACFTQNANLYVTEGVGNRIVAFSPDKSSFAAVVDDGGELVQYPYNVAFVSPYLFVSPNYNTGDLHLFDVDSVYQGVLANVCSAVPDLLVFPNRSVLAVTCDSENAIKVLDLGQLLVVNETYGDSILSGQDKTEDDFVIRTIENVTSPYYITFGERADEEILITTIYLHGHPPGQVLRRCISSLCDNLTRDSVMVTSQKSFGAVGDGFSGIATIPERAVFLTTEFTAALRTSVVYSCSLTTTNQQDTSSCKQFVPPGTIPSPWAIITDSAKSIVYISDWLTFAVSYVTYDGEVLGRLGKHKGYLSDALGIALRPGAYAPLSTFSLPPQTSIAGEIISFSMTLRDSNNRNVAAAFNRPLPTRYSIYAEGNVRLADGTLSLAKVDGSVAQGSLPGELVSHIELRGAGVWSLSIIESGAVVKTHLLGSPFEVVVLTAETSAPNCITMYKNTMYENDFLQVSISTFDRHSNPTSFENDVFVGWFEGSEDETGEKEETRSFFQNVFIFIIRARMCSCTYCCRSPSFLCYFL